MPNSITNRQLVFILFTTLTTVTAVFLPQVMALSAGTGAWFTIMLGSVVFGLVTVLIVKLNSMFPGKALFDYSGELAGKLISYILAVFYILYFLIVSTYLCVNISSVVTRDFLPKTPLWAELGVGMPVFGYIAYKGITNVARLFEIVGMGVLIITTFIFITMTLQGDTDNVLPLFNPSDLPKYLGASKDIIVPFLGMELLTIFPFTSKNKGASKVALFTLIGIGLYYVLVVEATFMMICPKEVVMYKDPLIEAFRLTEYKPVEFLQRIDIFYLTFGLAGVIAGKSIVILAIVEYACRIFAKVKRIFIVMGTCTAVFILSLTFSGMEDFADVFTGIITWAGIIAALLIPLALYIIARVKKHADKIN